MRSASLCLVLSIAAVGAASAATLELTLKDARGAPAEDAVAWLIPRSGQAPALKREAAIAQKDKTFIPLVTVIQTGTAVQFPNRDPIRHHVYSFSTPKPFEIKLYAGTPVAPIVFDKPGEVVLGCNIHDHMLAFVYIVDTPWYAKANKDGVARIENLPQGEYVLNLAHYRQAAPIPPAPLAVRDETVASAITLQLKPAPSVAPGTPPPDAPPK